jgi:hypothetical protein
LKHETEYQTHCGAAKMSFRQRGDLLLCWRMDSRKWGIGLSTVVNGLPMLMAMVELLDGSNSRGCCQARQMMAADALKRLRPFKSVGLVAR